MIAVQLSEQGWWYIARSSGFLCWATVTLSVIWGLALSTKLMGKAAGPAWLLDVHRLLGALSMIFLGIHMGALVADSYVYFGWAELFVPFASPWQPGAVAWGIAAMYLMIAVEVTSLMMAKIPRKMWRWIHFTAFVVYATTTVHAIEAGSDITNTVFRYAALASVQIIVFLIGLRVVTARRLKRALRASQNSPNRHTTVDDARQRRLADLRAAQAAGAGRAPTGELAGLAGPGSSGAEAAPLHAPARTRSAT